MHKGIKPVAHYKCGCIAARVLAAVLAAAVGTGSALAAKAGGTIVNQAPGSSGATEPGAPVDASTRSGLGSAANALTGMVIGSAVAQPALPAGSAAAQCDNSSSLGANAQLRVSQQNGRALVEITKPNSSGRKLDIEYGDELYSLRFGPDGRVRAGFALTSVNNQFTLNMSETPPINCTVAVPDFARLYRVILRWRDPVQLDLNVIEPGGRTNELGHVTASRPNSNLTQGIGQMDVVSGIPGEGATGEVSYVVANPSVIPPNSVFSYRLEYVTRGQQPESPFCDDFPLAAPQFEFITIENGTVSVRKMSVSRARCREKIADSRRLMPIRQ